MTWAQLRSELCAAFTFAWVATVVLLGPLVLLACLGYLAGLL